jgi:hypothetical protein
MLAQRTSHLLLHMKRMERSVILTWPWAFHFVALTVALMGHGS